MSSMLLDTTADGTSRRSEPAIMNTKNAKRSGKARLYSEPNTRFNRLTI